MSLMGIAIVTYNSTEHILPCLETLLASTIAHRLRIVIVDNASTDGTVSMIRNWATGRIPAVWPPDCPVTPTATAKPVSISHPGPGRIFDLVTLIEADRNGGFAAGVNTALKVLRDDPEIDRFWVLNPDSLIPPDTPEKLMNHPPGFGLLGNRVAYAEDPQVIQIDAGRIDRWTGRTDNISLGEPVFVSPPDITQADFICGASMVASRRFLETAGLMPEEYFLYYEEVAWAQRRGNLPLAFHPNALVYHVAGGSIGSPTLSRGPSCVSLYHKHRSRMIFIRDHHPSQIPTAIAFGLAKAGQALIKQGPKQAVAVLYGLFGAAYPFTGQANSPYATAVATADKSPW